MLNDEQAIEIKKQILSQIENFPLEQREAARQQITAMSNEQLEQFLIQNKLVKSSGGGIDSGVSDEDNGGEESGENSSPGIKAQSPINKGIQGQCVFCSIVQDKINSFKVNENKDAIAILEINPISNAHVLVIPKKHVSSSSELPQTVFTLSKRVAKKIKTKFKPKEIVISSSCVLGHCIVNILPVYENESLDSQRHKASQEELKDLQSRLEVKKRIPKPKKDKIEIKESKNEIRIPKRIP